MKQTGVSAKISADSSEFTRACSQARIAAAALTKDLKKVKFEGFGGGMHRSADGKEMISFERQMRTERKLTNLEYEKTNRLLAEMAKKVAIPDMRSWSKAVMSGRSTSTAGQWSHLAGTQFAGGSRGSGGGRGKSGWGNASGFGIGYNAIQDLVQGGPMAIANNIPQIIELVARNPALKLLGSAAAASAAGYFAYDQISSAYRKHGALNVANRSAATARQFRADQAAYQQGQAEAEGGLYGEKKAEALSGRTTLEASRERVAATDFAAAVSREELLQQIREQGIARQKDQAKVIQEMAASQIKAITLITDAETMRAKKVMDNASWATREASLSYEEARAELEKIEQGNRRDGTNMTGAERVRLAELRNTVPALRSRYDTTVQNEQEAAAGVRAALNAAEEGRLRQQLIGGSRDDSLGELGRSNLDKIFASLTRGTEAAMRVAEAYEAARLKAAEQAKQQGKMEEQLQIAELTSGGRRSRRAEKMQRGMQVDEAAKRYEAANYNPETARAKAEREIAAGERRPGTIRGAGFGGKGAPERGSALDYFDGKKMDSPATSSLDDYEARRRIPGVGKSVDKKLADDAKVEVAKPNPKGDPAVVSLLKAILGALGGKEPDSSTSSGSGRQTIKGAGYQG